MDRKKITVKVEIPVGYDLIINGTDCKLVPKKVELPKTWEEFCKMHPAQKGECFIGTGSEILMFPEPNRERDDKTDRNCLPNKQIAEAVLALCQLIQLRDYYNGDWKADWNRCTEKYAIIAYFNDTLGKVIIDTGFAYHSPCILAFKSKELRDLFFVNFRGLIDAALPLINH